MSDFQVSLHPQQLEVYSNPSRFKIVVAGRRWGKSRLALYDLFVEALKASSADVYYISPTFEQGKRIMWRLMKEIGRYGRKDSIIEWVHENTGVMRLINGRQIHICGSDRPDTIRGVPMAKVVLDEYASMKPMVWEEIVEPALIDTKGSAMFIGTPAGKNHFYELFMSKKDDPDWACWQFKTMDNPFLDKVEVGKRMSSMSTQTARQELEGSFEAFTSGLFKESWINYGEEPADGDWVISVDLAGFEETTKARGKSTGKLDETAVCAVKVHERGWFVGEIEHGRWNIRETSVRILRLAQEKHARCIGIEQGSLMKAVLPYMEDQMRRIGYHPRIEPTTHGGRSKTDRAVWALQGRLERGTITFKRSTWNKAFISQLLDFPNPLAHDDMVDALSYVDQIWVTPYGQLSHMEDSEDYEYSPVDLVAGY